MQFKHPEILYFLFLLVIPILVHLFQLRRFKKEYFTNVRFLKELSIQTRKSATIKKWLLLATRLLLLACIILAFAQPFFNAKDQKNTSNEMYIILDNSFSMQAKGKNGELLKRAVQDILKHTPENTTFSLLTNDDAFWDTDIRSLQKELQQLSYSSTPFMLDNQTAKIKAKKSPFRKDIVVITDGIGTQAKQLKNIDTDFNPYFVLPEAENRNNIATDSVYIHQTLDNFYEIKIKLSQSGKFENKIPVAVYNGTNLIATTQVAFTHPTEEIGFTIPKGDFNGYVVVTDNSLEYDNKLFFSITQPAKVNVISIGADAKSLFLNKIYTPDDFHYSNSEVHNLDYNLLEKQDAIILNELADIPQALQTTLNAFVKKGGNVVVIPSLENPVANLNGFLANFGRMSYGPSESKSKIITKIAFGHPLYQGVFEKKTDNFQYPSVQHSFVLSGGETILGFEDQTPFLAGQKNLPGSVYVFAGPINTVNSNFQNAPLIVPTFYNMPQNSENNALNALVIGQTAPLFVEANLAKEDILTVKQFQAANSTQFIPTQQILNNKVRISFGESPQEAGNYGIYKKEALLKNISFNYSRSESDLSPPDTRLFADYKTSDSVETIFDTLQSERTNTEIWKWFVVLALLFLVTEIFIQKFVK